MAQAIVSEAAWDEPRLRALAQAARRASRSSRCAAMAALGDARLAGADRLPGRGAGRGRDRARRRRRVVLDRIQDAGNVGSVLRSAAAFGFTQVIALEGTAALWSPKVAARRHGRALRRCASSKASTADALAALAVPLFATSSHAARARRRLRAAVAVRLGVRPRRAGRRRRRSRRAAGPCCAIPQPGGEESLNVAAAAAICLYETARRHGALSGAAIRYNIVGRFVESGRIAFDKEQAAEVAQRAKPAPDTQETRRCDS